MQTRNMVIIITRPLFLAYIQEKPQAIKRKQNSKVKISNDETKKAIEEARKGINMESISLEEMIAEQENIKNA